MKTLIWAIFFVLMVLWTSSIALIERLSQWLLVNLGSGPIQDLADVAGPWPVPEWLAMWVDPVWLGGLQEMGVGMLQWLKPFIPSSAGLMDWISPLLWITWGLGCLVLLVCAFLGAVLIGRRSQLKRTIE